MISAISISYEQLHLDDDVSFLALLLLRAASYCLPGIIPRLLLIKSIEKKPHIIFTEDLIHSAFQKLANLGLIQIPVAAGDSIQQQDEEHVISLHFLISDYVRRRPIPLPQKTSTRSRSVAKEILNWWRRYGLRYYNDSKAVNTALIELYQSIDKEGSKTQRKFFFSNLVLAFLRAIQGNASIESVKLCDTMRQTCLLFGEPQVAVTAAKYAAIFAEQIYGKASPNAIEMGIHYANVLLMLGRFDEASFCFISYGLRTNRPWKYTPRGTFLLAQIYDGIGKYYLAMGQYQDACQNLELAYEGKQRVARGVNDPIFFTTIASLAVALFEIGDISRAKRYAEFSQILFAESTPKFIDEWITCVLLVGDIEVEMMNYETATITFERAVNTSKIHFGDKHPSTLKATAYLGKHLSAIGDTQRAEKYLDEAISSCKIILGEEHPQTLRTVVMLCDLYIATDRTKIAQGILSGVQQAQEVSLVDNSDLVETLMVIANMHIVNGDYLLARKTLRTALRKQTKLYGRIHRKRADVIEKIGNLLLILGKRGFALVRLEQVTMIRSEVLGARHPKNLVGQIALEQLYWQTRQPEISIQLLEKLYNELCRLTSRFSPLVAFLLLRLLAEHEILQRQPSPSLLEHHSQVRKYCKNPLLMDIAFNEILEGLLSETRSEWSEAEERFNIAYKIIETSISLEEILQKIAPDLEKDNI